MTQMEEETEEKRVLEGVAHDESRLSGQGRNRMGYGVTQERERERERTEEKIGTVDGKVGGGERGGGNGFN